MVTMKLPFDAIGGSRHTGDAPVARPPGDPLDSSASHQPLDGLMADGDAVAEGQIGIDPPDAVRASGRDVHLADHLGEPGVADGAC